MTYEEFLSAMTPYNYQAPKSHDEYMRKYHDKIDAIFQIADIDGNGLISFSEFFYFVAVIDIPV